MRNSKFFEITSDVFFKKNSKLFFYKKIDVAFVDGLHTYEQALKDIENCLKYLEDGGVIVVHDCNPLSRASVCRSQDEAQKTEGWNGSWNGDVWKTIAHLRSVRDDLNIFVLNTDHGLGIIRKSGLENKLKLSVDEIKNMSYKDLDKDRINILNLKEISFFDKFLSEL